MQARDRVKQTAIHVSASSFDLAGGAAAEGHLTFDTAYSFSSFGEQSWDDIPVLIERSNGEWQIMVAKLNFDISPAVQTLSDAVFYSSSTGAALAFTASEEVTVTLAQAAYLFSGFAVQVLAPPTGTQGGDGRGYFPYLGATNQGLFAVGQAASAQATDAIAMGRNALATKDYAVALGGYRAFTYRPGEVSTGVSEATLAAGTIYFSTGKTLYSGETTDATPLQLGYNTPDGLLANSEGLYINSGVVTLTGILTAIEVATGDRKVWRVEVIAESTMDYLTTSIISQTFTELAESAGATAWTAQFTADSVANELHLEVTGEAAKSIAWMGSFTQHYHGVDQ